LELVTNSKRQIDYVLGDWDEAEKTALPERLN
jgi:hypothetical protein